MESNGSSTNNSNNSKKEGIMVAIRMRPMNEREISGGQEACFSCSTQSNSVSQIASNGHCVEGQSYFYDKVFDTNSATAEVYDQVSKDIVNGVVRGINGTIFAYGQTSSGKTHTMLGKVGGASNERGILEMATEDIFHQISECETRDFLLRVSFVEIYCENIRDLLSDAADPSVNIREDPRKGVYCEASEVVISDYDTILRCLRKGNSRRTVESTNMNEFSSRSHTIFKLVIESKENGRDGRDPDEAVLVASLNLVDLAGSESVKHTGATGQRAKEGGNINKSLLSLSRVIQSLSVVGAHVNFRDSKLTRLLQPSLSGNAKMAIICCITPADRFLDDTRGTLQFASRAKLVTTHATVNEVLDDSVKLKRLQKELNDLKDKQKGAGVSDEEFQRMESDKLRLQTMLAELAEESEKQRQQLEHLRHLVVNATSSNSSNTNGEDGFFGDDNNVKKRQKKKVRDTWCPGLFGKNIVEFDANERIVKPLSFDRSGAMASSSSLLPSVQDENDDPQLMDALHLKKQKKSLDNQDDTVMLNDDATVCLESTDLLLPTELDEARSLIVQLREQIEFLQEHQQHSMEQNDQQQQLREAMSSLVTERDNAVETLEIEMGANAEMEASLRAQINTLSAQLAAVSTVNLATATTTTTNDDGDATEKIEGALSVNELQLINQVEALTAELNLLQSSSNSNNIFLQSKTTEVEQLQQQLIESNDRFAVLQREHDEFVSMNSLNSKTIAQSDDLLLEQQQKIESLTENTLTLKDLVNRLELELISTEESKYQMIEDIKIVDESNKRLKEEMELMSTETCQLKKEVSNLTQINIDLLEQVAIASEETKNTIATSANAFKTLEEQVEHAEQAVSALILEKLSLQVQLQGLTESIAETAVTTTLPATSGSTVLEEELNVANEMIVLLQQQVDEKSELIATFEMQIIDSETLVSTLRSQLEQLQCLKTNMDNSLTSVCEDSKLLQSKLTLYEQENNELQEQLSQLKQRVCDAEAQRQTQSACMDILETEKFHLQNELATMEKKMNSQISETQESEIIADMTSVVQFDATATNTLIAQLQQEKQQLEQELSGERSKKEELELEVEEVDMELKMEQSKTQRLEANIMESKMVCADMQKNMAEFMALLQEATSKEQTLLKKVAETKEEVATTQMQLHEVEKHFEEVVSEVVEVRNQKQELQTMLMEHDSIILAMKEQIQQLQQELDAKNAHICSLSETASALSIELTTAKLSLTEAVVAQEQQGHQPNLCYENMESNKKETDRALQQMSTALGIKESLVSQLMSSVADLEMKLNTATQALEVSKTQQHQVYQDDDAMRKKISQLQTVVDLLKSEKDVLLRKVSDSERDFEELLQRVEHQHQQQQQQQQTSVFVSNDHTTTNDEQLLQSRCNELEATVSETNQRLKKAKEEKEMLQSEMKRLNEQTEMHEQQFQRQVQQLQEVTSERDEMMTELEKSLQQVQELTEALIEVETMSAANKASEAASEESKIVVAALEKKLEQLVIAKDEVMIRLEESTAKYNKVSEENFSMVAKIAEQNLLLQEKSEQVVLMEATIDEQQREIRSLELNVIEAREALELARTAVTDETLPPPPTTMPLISQAELEHLQDQLSDLEREKAHHQSAVDGYKSALEKGKLMLQELEMILANTKQELQMLQSEKSTLLQELSDKDEALACVENENFDLKQQQQQQQQQQLYDVNAQVDSEGEVEREKLETKLLEVQREMKLLQEQQQQHIEVLDVKEKRIAHLEKHKLTKDHLEMINKLKDERKKFQEDNRVMKKQLTDLKKAYENLREASATSTSTGQTPINIAVGAKTSSRSSPRSTTAPTSSTMQGGATTVNTSQSLVQLESEMMILQGELDSSQSLVNSLKSKLRDCSKQLQEYETERASVLDLLEEEFGIDTSSLSFDNRSNDNQSEASQSVLEQELVDVVRKLGEKYLHCKQALTQQQQQQTTSSTAQSSTTAALVQQQEKVKELEKQMQSLEQELLETKSQRLTLEKRLEASKSSSKSSREEIAQLTITIDTLRTQNNDLQSQINEVHTQMDDMMKEQQKQHQQQEASADKSPSAEIQALEEENIELLKENKELRKEVATYKAKAPVANALASASSSLGRQSLAGGGVELTMTRQFGTDIGNRLPLSTNVDAVSDSGLLKRGKDLSSSTTIAPSPKKEKKRRMSGALASVDENAPSECAQS